MEEQKDYFNLYVESIPNSQNGDFKQVPLIACDKEEIIKYFDFIKKKQFEYKPFGNQQVEVIVPRIFFIFDFSKTGLPSSRRNKEGYIDEVRIRHKRIPDYLRVFRELGDDITNTFNINLEEILGSAQPTATTPITATNTTKAPLITTTKEGVTTKEPEQTQENVENVDKTSASIDSSSRVTGNLTSKVAPIFPLEYSYGILDNSIEPAFDVKKVAKVFALHIKNLKDESGQMVGIFGKWGRGKTYFTNQVFAQFSPESTSPFIRVKFQAWKYQNSPSIWAYLFETIITEYLKVKWYKKVFRIIRLSATRQENWKSFILASIGIIIGIFTFSFTPLLTETEDSQILIKIISFAGILTISADRLLSILKKIKKPALNILNSISKIPSFKDVLGVQAEIQKELKNLIKVWSKIINNKRILLFIDDLDRCSDHQIIDIIDSLRVILDDELITDHVLILVALDEVKLKKAIKNKYEKLFEKEELLGVVDEYMDKLFISAIKLFPISFDERAEFVKKLVSQINADITSNDNLLQQPKSTPIAKVESEAELETVPEFESNQLQTHTPSPSPEDEKNSKNLDAAEINLLEEKIKFAKKDLTPRQIRILIYRYLLARNVWLVFYKELNWMAGDAIDEIMRFSGFNNEDPNAETKVFQGLSKIVRMVVAY